MLMSNIAVKGVMGDLLKKKTKQKRKVVGGHRRI